MSKSYANPKVAGSSPKFCPVCQRSKREDFGSIRGVSKGGREWAGQYAAYECGLLVVLRHGLTQMWNPCEFQKGVIDVEVISIREVPQEEIRKRQEREAKALGVFEQGGRFIDSNTPPRTL